jgi:hypothetical protein
MSAPARATATATATATGNRFQRHAITENLLSALEDLVHRYRTLALHTEHADLHAEVITAELAHQLAVARSGLKRYPYLG